ncbi:MAG TPA: penicillin-binding protein 1C [Chthoniobacterales bacterium]|nr:penicillin-binding protein 1C [Chthoniobacterales bacterium]
MHSPARYKRALPGLKSPRGIIGCSAVLMLIGLAIVLWPLPKTLRTPLTGTLTLLDIRGREIAQIASPTARAQLPRGLKEMGPWLPQVTVALEDHRFYKHRGVDWHALVGAAARNARSGRVISGGSTISQQLAKLARGRQRRGWFNKLDETLVAWKLERVWSKERILTEYLNRSSYGNRRLGPEAASRAYFGKPARDLTLPESIFLAGLPQAPSRFNPWTRLDQATRRYARSLGRLESLGVITPQQHQLLAKSPPSIGRFTPPRLAPHFVDSVVQRSAGHTGPLTTALDLDLQSMAERCVAAHLRALNRGDVSEAAVVIMDNETSAVRAMVGSSNYSTSQVNAAMRPHSCGSTLKPFVYLSAIDRRLLTAASLLPDTPDAIRDAYDDYDPQNYSHRYFGPVRLREALACSLNVPAVVAVSRLGARQTFFELQKWGFTFARGFDDYGAGFILGNAEIRPVDLAAAYAGLARGGIALQAKLLAAEHHPMSRLISREGAAIITDILADNAARERVFGRRSPLAFPERVAAKTGTSSGFRDAWTVGFTREHTVAVWAGNINGRPMRDTLAVRSATPLWASIIRELLAADHPLESPTENNRLVRREICPDTGLLPSRLSRPPISEWFLKGTEPLEDSKEWFASDGKLVLPEEYAAWCKTSNNQIGARAVSSARIVNPIANARYTIDRDLPRTQQMVEFTTNFGAEVQWYVNGQLQMARPDGRVFWQLQSGEWKLRAVGPRGTAEQTISVE